MKQTCEERSLQLQPHWTPFTSQQGSQLLIFSLFPSYIFAFELSLSLILVNRLITHTIFFFPHSCFVPALKFASWTLSTLATWRLAAAAAAAIAAPAKSLQSCPTLCDPPPGSPIPGILQARTLEWITWRLSLCNYSSSFLHHYFFVFHWFIPMSLKDIAVSTILQCFSLFLVRECNSKTTPPVSIPNCHFKPLQLGSVPITPLTVTVTVPNSFSNPLFNSQFS